MIVTSLPRTRDANWVAFVEPCHATSFQDHVVVRTYTYIIHESEIVRNRTSSIISTVSRYFDTFELVDAQIANLFVAINKLKNQPHSINEPLYIDYL